MVLKPDDRGCEGSGTRTQENPLSNENIRRRNKGDFLSRTHPPERLPRRKERKERGKERDGRRADVQRKPLTLSSGAGSCASHRWARLCLPQSCRMLTPNRGGLSPAPNLQAPVSSSAGVFLKVKQPVPWDSGLCKPPLGANKPL